MNLAILSTGYFLAVAVLVWFFFEKGKWVRQRIETEKTQASLQAELAAEKNRLADREKSLMELREEHKAQLTARDEQVVQLQDDLMRAKSDWVQLKTSLEEREKKFQEQLAQIESSKESMKQEFSNLANEILEKKGKVFADQSNEKISMLLNPFKEQMSEFRRKIESIHEKDISERSALQNELKNIKELNRQMSEEAAALTKALKGDKKAQGNWGELMLENVLERSGLRKDEDYFREKSVTGEETRGRMDVVVRLPEKRHLIIDSKVSLNAYTRAINAEDEQTRQLAMSEHLQALQNRIKELAEKDYTAYDQVNSPDMVFMFVPVESAFVEAFRMDELLVQKALDKGIVIATPTTLLASLKIVAQLWRLENQNKSTAALADRARKVYDKLNGFLGSMERLGHQLNTASKTYDQAVTQLTQGKGNLVKQVMDFKDLGVRVGQALPEYFTDRAELELSAAGDLATHPEVLLTGKNDAKQ